MKNTFPASSALTPPTEPAFPIRCQGSAADTIAKGFPRGSQPGSFIVAGSCTTIGAGYPRHSQRSASGKIAAACSLSCAPSPITSVASYPAYSSASYITWLLIGQLPANDEPHGCPGRR